MAELSDLQRSVLTTLASHPASLTEGELAALLVRGWSLAPTLRSLQRRGLVARSMWWSWRITDAGLAAVGVPARVPGSLVTIP